MDYTKEFIKQKRNNKLKGIFIGIGILLIALIGSTYAFFTYSKSLQAFTLTSSGITATFGGESNQINITSAYPISDEFALENLNELDYIDFTIEGNITDPDQGLSYEIYLTEKDSNTLDSNYIKVYITDENGEKIKDPKIYNSLDNTTYSKDSSTGKVIYKLEGMPGSYSKSFRIYAWIDKDYEQNAVQEEFSFYVNLYAYNSENRDGAYLVKRAALARSQDGSNCRTYVEEDGITYISGTKECINFNYVWWSGKMWRITAIYSDGAMKMVTDNMITSIAFNEESELYYNKSSGAKSYIYNFLNEDFRDTLYNHGDDVIDKTKYWNATMPANTNIKTKPSEADATMIPTTTSPIGLLNSYEYYKSYQNTTYGNGYLNIGYYWWLLNPYDSTPYNSLISDDGSYAYSSLFSGVRPSIYIKSKINFSGSGTKESPYRISEDYSNSNINDNLYTRHSGEYIKFESEGVSGNYDAAPLYRIVGVEGEGENRFTKIVSMDYALSGATKKIASTINFGASGNTESVDFWDYYLNNDWYNNLSFKDNIQVGSFYIGPTVLHNIQGAIITNYKLSICGTETDDTTATCLINENKRVTKKFVGNIGLLRYGEMFATQQNGGKSNSKTVVLISNDIFYNYVWVITSNGKSYTDSRTYSYSVRPSMYLKSSVKILSGSGTELDPYIVS